MNITQEMIDKAFAFPIPELVLSQFPQKYSKEHNFSEKDTRELFEETKKFLIVCAQDRSQRYCPSNHVDEMWHEFILSTRDYVAFCDLLGGYIHHASSKVYPEFFSNAVKGIASIFKSVNPKWWNVHFVEGEVGADPYCDGSSCYC